MSSPMPSRSIDPHPDSPNTRSRSSSLPIFSRSSLSVVRHPLARRSQTPKETPKAKRKIVSNRSTPYTVEPPSRSNRSTTSKVGFDIENEDLDEGLDQLSINVTSAYRSRQSSQTSEDRDPFERPFEEAEEKTEEKAAVSGHLSIAEVMKHFTPQVDNKYICKICNEVKTANASSVFNLRRHLYIRHQIEIDINPSYNRKKKNPSSIHSIVSQERRHEIDNLLMNCIIRGGLPYNHFSHPWFHALFENMQPGYRPPDRRTLAKRIHSRYREYINELKDVLPKDCPIAYTTDVWKSSTRNHYICLTAHVFNDDMKPVSLLLSFRRLTDRKLAKNLNEYIAYELNRFGLKDCVHAGITTDNASDMKAATGLGDFGPRFPCIAHTVNLIVHHGLCIWEKPNEDRYPFKPYQKRSDEEDDEDEDDVIDAEEAIEIPQPEDDEQRHENDDPLMPSVINSESLILLPGEDEYISEDEDSNDSPPLSAALIDAENKRMLKFLGQMHDLASQSRKLVKITRNVSVIDQYVRENQDGPKNGFVIDMRIRWNNTFYMLRRLLHYQEIVKSVFTRKFPTITAEQRSSLAKVHLDHDNWDILQALHDVLEPLELATRSLSGKHYATLALAYTTINILKYWLKPKHQDSMYLAWLKKSVLAQFELYFDLKMTNKQKELMLIAAYLDPESHQQLSRDDKQAAKNILPNYMKKEADPIVGLPTSTSSTSGKATLTLTEKLKIMASMPSKKEQHPRLLSIEEELVLFTQSIQTFKGDFASFWVQHRGRYCRLYLVARRVNIIAATSVPSESTFSIAGFVARKQRTSLSSTSLRYLMVLKESHCLDDLRSKPPRPSSSSTVSTSKPSVFPISTNS